MPRSKRGIKGFFSETRKELKKVHWPTRQENLKMSGVVLGISAMMAVLLLVLGYLSNAIVSLIVTGKVN
jgi:preprotein translocase subunit SecE